MIQLTEKEKAARFDALQVALKVTKDRYSEREKKSRKVFKKSNELTELTAFEYGQAEAYKIVINDLERWIV